MILTDKSCFVAWTIGVNFTKILVDTVAWLHPLDYVPKFFLLASKSGITYQGTFVVTVKTCAIAVFTTIATANFATFWRTWCGFSPSQERKHNKENIHRLYCSALFRQPRVSFMFLTILLYSLFCLVHLQLSFRISLNFLQSCHFL